MRPPASLGGRRPARGRLLLIALVCAVAGALALGGCGSRLPLRDFASAPAAGSGTSSTGAGGRTPVRVGIIASQTSPLGGDALTGPMYGAQAFLKAEPELDGAPVRVFTCDDGGSGIGDQDCVHRLIDQDRVVALVATTTLDYAGASYVSAKGVPDIGGEPLGPAYDRYPGLYQIYGSSEPRDGSAVGWAGTRYQTTEVYRYFRQTLGARRAAVVSYNQSASASYAGQLAQGLRAEGYSVLRATVDFALPQFGSVAARLRNAGTQLLFDAMDTRGNAGLCQAMQADGVRVLAKVTNVQNWSEQAAADYAATPGCRNALWATSDSRSYQDVRYPAVRRFREAMARFYPDRAARMSQWELEGWAAAQWLADAAASCGPSGVRPDCLRRFMDSGKPYDAHGLIVPASFTHRPPPSGPQRVCLDVARWTDGRGWVTQVPDMDRNCFLVPALPYRS
ncbi:ABC transporter substrate-binding protein [Phaeacidiphilus oryzae]|uniref:ABC transporter substrate-binding protein n=1 Tax=Phaeacidiphilus oryzae TaxID=348818 RepID=UPI00389A5BA2